MDTAFCRVAGTIAAVLLLATGAHAQSEGSITGIVKDSSGGVLPGATVTGTNPTQAVTQSTQTSALGVFMFPQLLPGTYAIKVELSGFKTAESTGVILSTKSA